MEYKSRINKVLDTLESLGFSQMLVTDPLAVFYLTDILIWPGERFYGLLLSKTQEPVLILNELFSPGKDPGLKVLYYADGENFLPLLSRYVNRAEILGIDKTMPAEFLLAMIQGHLASDYANASPAVDAARAVKDPYEQECMRRASCVNDICMGEFVRCLRTNITESEMADEVRRIYRSHEAERVYGAIVAFGANSANPHHTPGETKLREGDLVLIDAGCVVNNYSCDMTRTFFFRRSPSEEQKRIYNIVLNANETAESVCAPGTRFCDADHAARDIICREGFGQYFTHRLGHFIGLKDHDCGDISAVNVSRMQIGNTFTVEPGIYHPEIAGVRIEDVVLITAAGHEVLNRYPKELSVIG